MLREAGDVLLIGDTRLASLAQFVLGYQEVDERYRIVCKLRIISQISLDSNILTCRQTVLEVEV
jgi:hypothetical protein